MQANWKTTVTAIIAIITIIGSVVNDLISGNPVNWGTVIPGIIGALGLIFAKDFNVTGGNKNNSVS